MIEQLDSAFPPSPSVIAAAKAGGVQGWSGYWSSAAYDGGSHFGLYHPWPEEAIVWVKALNERPIMYVSGWDSPAAIRAAADRLGFRPCVDVESGIRADGPWKQAFIDAVGRDVCGIYGNYGCHAGVTAAFHILAAYPGSGDVQATWWKATPRPAGPCGWQWCGTHTEFGVGCDRGDFDDYFAGGDDMAGLTPEQGKGANASHWRQAFFLGMPIPAPGTVIDDQGVDVSTYAIPGALSLKDLFDMQTGPPQFPLTTEGRVEKALRGIAASQVSAAAQPDRAVGVAAQLSGFVIPMLMDIKTAVGKQTANVDFSGVLAAIADAKAHPAATDPAVLALLANIEREMNTLASSEPAPPGGQFPGKMADDILKR